MKYTTKNTIEIGRPKRVFVDGVEINNVIECNTEEGYAIFHPVDENGDLCVYGGDIMTETIRGVVTVEDAA